MNTSGLHMFFITASKINLLQIFINKKSPTNFCKALIFLWEQTDSNRRPSACKADALNQLSYAPYCFFARAKVTAFLLPANFFSIFSKK